MRRALHRWFLWRANLSADYRHGGSGQIERSVLLRILVRVLDWPIRIGETFGVDHYWTLPGVFVVRHESRLRRLPMILCAPESRNLHRSNERSHAVRRLILKSDPHRVRIPLIAIHN